MAATKAKTRPPAEEATTRDRLLEAGLEIFGESGFAAASTRALAERSRVNLAAIPYHFGGKEGLYRAVVTAIAARVQGELAPLLDEVSALPVAAPPAQAAELLERLLGTLVGFVVGAPEAARFSRIVLREQLAPSPAYDIVFAGIMQPLLEALAALLAGAAGLAAADRRCRLQAMALLGQVLVFRFGRETVVRGIGLEGYSAAETAEIRAIVIEQVRLIVQGLGQHSPTKKRETP